MLDCGKYNPNRKECGNFMPSGFDALAGISFDEIFGANADGISFERVEAFLDKAVKVASDKSNQNPYQLVRVVHNGKVQWMTQAQAADFLSADTSEDEMRHDVERALRADLKFIRQELEILIALARYTLDQFKSKEAIEVKEIERIEPSLKRRQRELSDGVNETAESEAILVQKRKRAPLLEEYEQLMGEFIHEKSINNMQRASQLAHELSMRKKKYLLLSRSIEPDVKTIYYHRMNLQKTKKRILNTQNDLCKTRQDTLQFEVDDLQNRIKSVKDDISSAEGLALENKIQEMEMNDEQFDASEAQKMLNQKITEMNALESESAVIEKQEQQVQSVINSIAEDVLNEPDLKDDVQNVLKNVQQPKIQTEKKIVQPEKKRIGMHVNKNKR